MPDINVHKYVKKPVVVSAIQYDGDNGSYISAWSRGKVTVGEGSDRPYLLIATLEGVMRTNPGDYIIRGVEGEFYPCKPSIFNGTYERISNE